MNITSYKTVDQIGQVDTADARRLYDYPHLTVVHMLLEPGQEIPVHTVPGNVAFYILEGTPTIIKGTDERVCYADELIDSPAGAPHGIKNNGSVAARVLVIKQK